MLNYLKNKPIAIAGIFDGDVEYNSSHIHIYSGKDVLSPGVLNLPLELQLLSCSMEWLAIVVGSYFKGIIYKFLHEKKKRKEFTEVDSLLLANSLIQHIGIIVYEARKTIIIVYGSSTDYVLSHHYCSVLFVMIEFEFVYSVVGSLGISIYRILLVKANQLVKNNIGVRVMRNVILFGGIAFTSLFVALMNINGMDKLIGEKCAYVKDKTILDLIDDYQQSIGESSLFSFWHFSRSSIGVLLGTMASIEMFVYYTLYNLMQRHDNDEKLKRLLDPTVIRQRKRTNLINFMGQICLFVIKLALNIIFIVAVMFGNRENGIWMISMMIKTISFTILSLVEILMSRPLRHRLCQ